MEGFPERQCKLGQKAQHKGHSLSFTPNRLQKLLRTNVSASAVHQVWVAGPGSCSRAWASPKGAVGHLLGFHFKKYMQCEKLRSHCGNNLVSPPRMSSIESFGFHPASLALSPGDKTQTVLVSTRHIGRVPGGTAVHTSPANCD